MGRHTKLFCCALFAALAACVVVGGEPSVEVRVSSQEIYEGESIEYQLTLKNASEDATADAAVLKTEFDVLEAQPRPVRNDFRMSINGVVTEDRSLNMVFGYKLTPKRVGRLIIPPPKITSGGKTLAGQAVSLNVIAAEKQDIAIMEIAPSKARVFPMQPFEVNLKILLKPLPAGQNDPLSVIQPPALQINWAEPPPEGLKPATDLAQWLNRFMTATGRGFTLNGFTANNGDPFAFFERQRQAVFSLYTGREMRKGLDGKEYNYFVYELKRAFTPQRAASYKFGAATMKGTFVDGIAPDGQHFRPRQMLVVAPEKVVVCEMPEPKPANFCGAIGPFTLRADATPKDLRVGDPLALKLEFERGGGAGALEDVSAPDLSLNAQLTADFAIVDKAPPGQTAKNVKSFSYTLRPKKAGISVPALSVAVFNFNNGNYEELKTQAIALNVVDAPQLRPDELVSATPIGSGQKISGREKGVFQNITEISELNKPALNAPLYAGAVAGLWAMYGLGVVALTLRRKRAGDTVWQNRVRANQAAAEQMAAARAALKAGDAAGATLGVRRALTGLIGYRCGLEPDGMTAQDAAGALEKIGVSAEARAETVRLLEGIEAEKYGSRSSVEAESLAGAAEKLIPLLQKELDAKK